jgi:hypothetical protein
MDSAQSVIPSTRPFNLTKPFARALVYKWRLRRGRPKTGLGFLQTLRLVHDLSPTPVFSHSGKFFPDLMSNEIIKQITVPRR